MKPRQATCKVQYNVIMPCTSFILFAKGSVTRIGDFPLAVAVDTPTAVSTHHPLLVQTPKEATTMTAECWQVVIFDVEVVSMGLLHVD